MHVLERLADFAEFGAGWVLWLLVASAVVTLAIIIERLVLFLTSRDDIPRLRDDLRALLAQGEVAVARHRLEESPSFEARIARAGLDSERPASSEERMNAEAQLARLTMERNLACVGTLGKNAPFIGLLGTVIGIVRAFKMLEPPSGALSAGLMAEIGEALAVTAIGLIVALPAIASHDLFRRSIRARQGRAEVLCREILAHLKGREVGAQPAE
jgi:biopolymer transport protein ExbB